MCVCVFRERERERERERCLFTRITEDIFPLVNNAIHLVDKAITFSKSDL